MDWAGIDEWIYRRLAELVDVLPMRFVKLVAHNYTDARVRKLYWRRLGLEMGEDTYANLGLTLLSDDYTPRVHIGNHVSIAANVTFVPMASANNGQEINTYPYVRDHLTKAADIVVEDEVWIGADVTILPACISAAVRSSALAALSPGMWRLTTFMLVCLPAKSGIFAPANGCSKTSRGEVWNLQYSLILRIRKPLGTAL